MLHYTPKLNTGMFRHDPMKTIYAVSYPTQLKTDLDVFNLSLASAAAAVSLPAAMIGYVVDWQKTSGHGLDIACR